MSDYSEELKPIISPSPPISSNDQYLPSPEATPTSKTLIKGRKRSSISSSPTPTPKKSRKGRPVTSNVKGESKGNRKTGNWTKKEVRELWDAMGFLPVKVKWDEIAEKVEGRDKLSCQNKWRYDMLPKIQAFIDSLGD